MAKRANCFDRMLDSSVMSFARAKV
jgi:hypothetical protein